MCIRDRCSYMVMRLAGRLASMRWNQGCPDRPTGRFPPQNPGGWFSEGRPPTCPPTQADPPASAQPTRHRPPLVSWHVKCALVHACHSSSATLSSPLPRANSTVLLLVGLRMLAILDLNSPVLEHLDFCPKFVGRRRRLLDSAGIVVHH